MDCVSLAKDLSGMGFSAAAYHAGLTSNIRDKVQVIVCRPGLTRVHLSNNFVVKRFYIKSEKTRQQTTITNLRFELF